MTAIPKPILPHDHTSFSRGGVLNDYARADALRTGGGGGTTSGGVTDHGLLSGLADDDHSAYLTVIGGGEATVQAHGNFGATETIDLSLGNAHWGTLNAACTFTFSGATNLKDCGFTLELIEDGTGGWSPTWPGSVVWLGGTMPVHTTTLGTTTIYAFFSRDGGTTWVGGQLGAGATFATPAIVLGTAAAAGAATTVIRSDSTIAAFDATVPVTQAYSDAAATGSAAFAARRDHKHGMPASGGIGPLLISDTPSTPLVFADILQNEAQTDLVYADP